MFLDVPRWLKAALRLLTLTFRAWHKDRATLMAAALAFYTLISVAPLLIILLAVAGTLFGPQEIERGVVRGTQVILGDEAAELLRTLISGAELEKTKWLATILGLTVVLYGSTRVFAELQRALRVIWQGPDEPLSGAWPLSMVKTHLASFLMVIGVGLLWLVGAVSSTAISVVGAWMTEAIPAGLKVAALVHIIASVILLTASLALIYRFLPSNRVQWRDVWIGAGFTAVLITLGQKLIGLYLGYKSISSVYGAAGSLVVVIFWFYYSWLIFFLGAEFTKVYATGFRSHRKPPDETAPSR